MTIRLVLNESRRRLPGFCLYTAAYNGKNVDNHCNVDGSEINFQSFQLHLVIRIYNYLRFNRNSLFLLYLSREIIVHFKFTRRKQARVIVCPKEMLITFCITYSRCYLLNKMHCNSILRMN